MTVIVFIPALILIGVLVVVFRHGHKPVTQSIAASRHGVTAALSDGNSWRVVWGNVHRVQAWWEVTGRSGRCTCVELETHDLRTYTCRSRDTGWDTLVPAIAAAYDLSQNWITDVEARPIPGERVLVV